MTDLLILTYDKPEYTRDLPCLTVAKYLPSGDKHVCNTFLGKEADDLYHRLTTHKRKSDRQDIEKAIKENRLLILPVPVGQTVYRVHDRCRPPINACPFDGGFGISRCNGEKNCKEYYEPVPFRIESIAEWGINLFETEEEAMDEISRRRSK